MKRKRNEIYKNQTFYNKTSFFFETKMFLYEIQKKVQTKKKNILNQNLTLNFLFTARNGSHSFIKYDVN